MQPTRGGGDVVCHSTEYYLLWELVLCDEIHSWRKQIAEISTWRISRVDFLVVDWESLQLVKESVSTAVTPNTSKDLSSLQGRIKIVLLGQWLPAPIGRFFLNLRKLSFVSGPAADMSSQQILHSSDTNRWTLRKERLDTEHLDYF